MTKIAIGLVGALMIGVLYVASPGAQAAGTITKVLTIVEENHSLAQAQSGMPYLMGQARQYGYATGYSAVSHPSLPNYLAITAGSTFGITDDNDPSSHPLSGASVFGQALSLGKTAKAYAEGMPSNCALTGNSTYAVRHAPWPYYVDERAACNSFDVPLGTTSSGALLSDINAGTLPNAGLVTPSLCNDAHDCPLATADGWLQGWLPKLLAGPDFTAGRLAIVVTFDEGVTSNPDPVLTVVLAPGVSGKVVSSPLNHYSLTRLYDEVLGAPLLRGAAGANSMSAAFGLRT
jgi:phosphatidylinositol-3-phosphatase